MKKFLVVVLIVLAAIAVFFIARPMGADLDGLDGEPWIMVGVEMDGKKIPMDKGPRMRLKFEKDKVTWIVPGKKGDLGFEGPFKNDPSKTPKEIDVAVPPEDPNDPEERDQIAQGIYEIKDNTLLICVGPQRPTEFSARPRSNRVVWVFRRPEK